MDWVPTKAQKFLLEWLSKEDTSQLGECAGKDLDALIEHGLAWVASAPTGVDREYATVRLTIEGMKTAAIWAAEAALEFYADEISYMATQHKEPRTAVHGDEGKRAREALRRLRSM